MAALLSASGQSIEQLCELVEQHHATWLELPGVTAVGVGLKRKRGHQLASPCVRFVVTHKTDRIEEVPQDQQAKMLLDGALSWSDVDVVQRPQLQIIVPTAPKSEPAAVATTATSAVPLESPGPTRRHVILRPGVSVGNVRISAGTLGAIVFDAHTGEAGILSNWHVLDGDTGRTEILQPGYVDGGAVPGDVVASLKRSVIGGKASLDAAFATLTSTGSQRSWQRVPLGLQRAPTRAIAPLLGQRLIKSGRTTGVTRGVVTAVNQYSRINYGGSRGTVAIRSFEIESHHGRRTAEEVSEGGDSGSVWVLESDQRFAVGLHFGGESAGIPNLEFALVCPIAQVLAALNVRLTPPVHIVSAAFAATFATNQAVTTVDISNLAQCIQEGRASPPAPGSPPAIPTEKAALLALLRQTSATLAPIYRREASSPLIEYVEQLSQQQIDELLSLMDSHPFADLCHAVIQNQQFQQRATDSFQELVADLYDSYLSNAARVGTKPPDVSLLPPLVKWGNAHLGPYTWVAEATHYWLDLPLAIVSLPPPHAVRGLLAWTTLGHETGGHDVLRADRGLMEELVLVVRRQLEEAGFPRSIVGLWERWLDETASDILGLLHLGPAAGIGLIGYFRSLSADGRLRNTGTANDPHPIDVLRGFLAAHVIRDVLATSAAEVSQPWADVIEAQAQRDLTESGNQLALVHTVTGQRQQLPIQQMLNSTRVVARAIATTHLLALEGRSLAEIKNWTDADEQLTAAFRERLRANFANVPVDPGYKAAYVVAAAILEALSTNGSDRVPDIFQWMLKQLAAMHQANPRFRPVLPRLLARLDVARSGIAPPLYCVAREHGPEETTKPDPGILPPPGPTVPKPDPVPAPVPKSGGAAAPADYDSWNLLTFGQLKDECMRKGIDPNNKNKPQLIQELLKH